MSTGHESGLYYDLVAAGQAAKGERPCGLCQYINAQGDVHTRAALTGAASGTIGIRKLESILSKHDARDNDGNPVGRRTIQRHRNEEHTP